jgi:hypothetical protein
MNENIMKNRNIRNFLEKFYRKIDLWNNDLQGFLYQQHGVNTVFICQYYASSVPLHFTTRYKT